MTCLGTLTLNPKAPNLRVCFGLFWAVLAFFCIVSMAFVKLLGLGVFWEVRVCQGGADIVGV